MTNHIVISSVVFVVCLFFIVLTASIMCKDINNRGIEHSDYESARNFGGLFVIPSIISFIWMVSSILIKIFGN